MQTPDAPVSPSASLLARLAAKLSGAIAPLSFLIILCLVLARLSPNFATRDNFKQIAVQAAVVAILSCGQTAVIIGAQIDLAVGAIMAFSGVVAAVAMQTAHFSAWGGVGVACAAGLLLGAGSGAVTAFGGIPSFIVTLGMMGIVYGAAGIISHEVNISVPQSFNSFGWGELFGGATRDGIPYPVITLVVAALAVHVLLSRTRWGRAMYAIGGNMEAARLAGIRVKRAITAVFALSGLLAGVAAVVNTSRTGVASMNAGLGYELDAVAATVIGGTSLFGGKGGIGGTIIGAVLIYTIRNGCALQNLGPDYVRAIIGFVVILAVLYDRYGPGRTAAHRAA